MEFSSDPFQSNNSADAEAIEEYEKVISTLPKEDSWIPLTQYTKDFGSSLSS